MKAAALLFAFCFLPVAASAADGKPCPAFEANISAVERTLDVLEGRGDPMQGLQTRIVDGSGEQQAEQSWAMRSPVEHQAARRPYQLRRYASQFYMPRSGSKSHPLE